MRGCVRACVLCVLSVGGYVVHVLCKLCANVYVHEHACMCRMHGGCRRNTCTCSRERLMLQPQGCVQGVSMAASARLGTLPA